MDILLVKPDIGAIIEDYNLNDGCMEPLALGVLAGLTPEHHAVRLLDDRKEAVTGKETADLVAITVDTYTARRAYELADAYRAAGVPVCLGGVHVTLLPDEAEDHADALLLGDAETAWATLLKDFENDRLAPRYQGEFVCPQVGTFPDRSLFRNQGYLPVSQIQFSRGCPFHCAHCSVSRIFGHAHHFRPGEEIVEEIERFDLKFLLFVDDNITANPDRAKELFEALMPLKIRWSSQASIDMVEDSELMDLMVRSGCIGQLIGFESIDPGALVWMKKTPNLRDFDRYHQVIEVMRKYGLMTWAAFMVGGDQDTPETVRETVEFAIRSRFGMGFFHLFTPYPGTEIYDQFEREDRLLFDRRWWLHPDYRYNVAAFEPANMTPDELGRLVVEANRKFYGVGSIWRRMLDRKTNMKTLLNAAFCLRYNWVMRRTSV
jgi:radical SAM superfamily enzyme YgiQ (UPF0313 family)